MPVPEARAPAMWRWQQTRLLSSEKLLIVQYQINPEGFQLNTILILKHLLGTGWLKGLLNEILRFLDQVSKLAAEDYWVVCGM